MLPISDPDLTWAVSKALLIVTCTFATIVGLAWVGVSKIISDNHARKSSDKLHATTL